MLEFFGNGRGDFSRGGAENAEERFIRNSRNQGKKFLNRMNMIEKGWTGFYLEIGNGEDGRMFFAPRRIF
jgi:hypothetical protein